MVVGSLPVGILLLALYYFAYPPFGASYPGISTGGHFWIVNRNLIEIIALLVITVFPVREFSIERLSVIMSRRRRRTSVPASVEEGGVRRRRELLKGLATLPVFGGMLIGTAVRGHHQPEDIRSFRSEGGAAQGKIPHFN